MTLDASRITGNLWQGGKPPQGPILRFGGFDTLVLCAQEIQEGTWPDVKVLRAPNDDGPPPTGFEIMIARLAAGAVVRELGAGKRVLVTCRQGRNRSGLVSALAMVMLGWPAEAAIRRIRERRRDALTNEHFVRVIESFARRLQRQSAVA